MLLNEVSNLITRRLGILTREQDLDRLRATLAKRCELLGLRDLSHYLRFLKGADAAAENEWNELTVLLTTGETFFFRDQGQAHLLRETIFPELIERRRAQRQLRIWSAGCSTGEEPYSLVIMLSELVPDLDKWKLYLLATDINAKALAIAQQGIYGYWSFRGMDPQSLPKYFQRNGEKYQVAEKLRNKVTFQTKNLLTDEYPNAATREMDLIVCRNVFIYFGGDHVTEIVGRFKDCLCAGGYLLTGHGELQRVKSNPLRICLYDQSVVYRRDDAHESHKPVVKGKAATSTPEVLNAAVSEPDRTAPAVVEPASTVDLPASAKLAKTDPYQQIETLLLQGDHAAVAKAAEQITRDFPKDGRAIMILARAKADQANYNEATKHCRRAIELDRFAVDPRYLLSKIAEEQGRHDEALDLLKQVVYLDPEHVAAHLDLATLQAATGDREQANRTRRRLVEILKRVPDEQIIEDHGQLTAVELRHEILKQLGL